MKSIGSAPNDGYFISFNKTLEELGVEAIFGPGTNIIDAARRIIGLIEQHPTKPNN